jgi:hypothetical protein
MPPMRSRMKKARTDIALLLAFMWLLTLNLLLLGVEPTSTEVVQVIAAIVVVCCAIVIKADQDDRHGHSSSR